MVWQLMLVMDLKVCLVEWQMKLPLLFSHGQYLQEFGLLHGLASISLSISPSYLDEGGK